MQVEQQQRNIQVELEARTTHTIELTVSTAEDNWNSLVKKVRETFELDAAASFVMKYTDDEGDLITLDSDNELRQALLAFDASGKPAHLVVGLVNPGPKKRLSREERVQMRAERLQKKQERVQARQERLARKQERCHRKQEGTTAEEAIPSTSAPIPSIDGANDRCNGNRLEKQQARLARREERLRLKAERIGARKAKPESTSSSDEDSRLKRREERLKLKAERIAARKANKNATCTEEDLKRREERLKLKAERIAARRANNQANRGADDDDSRQNRREERQRLRQERLLKRQEREKRKAEGHSADDNKPRKRREHCGCKREKQPDIAFYNLEGGAAWPEHGKQLFLDGNNMMYLTAALRSLTLNRSQGAGKAESLLEAVADVFMAKMGDRVPQGVLIFDHTRTDKTKTTLANCATLRVCSARPKYPTSDDALIDWAKLAGPEQAKGMVFVTSDRGLSVQLLAAGATLIKPKQFLRFVFCLAHGTTIPEGGESAVDAWLDTLKA